MHRDQRVQSVQQLLQRVDVGDVGRLQAFDAGDDRVVVMHHRDRRVGEADEPRPLGVEDLLLGLRVGHQGAAQKAEDPDAERVALVLRQPRHRASATLTSDGREQVRALAPTAEVDGG
jgi:hypothetical protein